jgi:hypothetical protein
MRAAFLDARLAEWSAGKAAPISAEQRLEVGDFALLCRRLPRAATALYVSAFAADPALKESYRPRAARAAALGGTGLGADAAELDEQARSRLRELAFGWLEQQAEYDAGAIFDGSSESSDSEVVKRHRETVRAILAHPDFACVRDKEGLAKLPEPERRKWRGLWAEYERLAQPPRPRDK